MATEMTSSKILKNLNSDEIGILFSELEKIESLWGRHYLRLTPDQAPLRHGKTIYIQALDLLAGKKIIDNKDKFSKTIELISEWTGNNKDKIARSYWHWLLPGDRIDIHRDSDYDIQGSSYFSSINRYQVFPKVSKDFIAVMDSQLWNFKEDKLISNKLIHFNPSDWHYYANHTKEDVKFLVVDFFK